MKQHFGFVVLSILIAFFAAAAISYAGAQLSADQKPDGKLSAAFLDWFAGWWLKAFAFVLRAFRPDGANVLDAWISGAGRFPVAWSWISLSLYLTLARSKLAKAVFDRLAPPFPGFLNPALTRPNASAISAFCEGEPFLARDTEVDALRERAHAGAGFAWTAIAGRMGMGKTRLALEAMKALRKEGWDAGLVEPGTDVAGLRTYRFRKPTVILIDDWTKNAATWAVLTAFAQREPPRHPVFVLMCDQTAPRPPLSLEADAFAAVAAAERGPPIRIGHLDETHARALAPGVSDVERRPLLLKLGNHPAAEIRRRARERLDLATEISGADGARLLALASLAGPFSAVDANRLVPGITEVAILALLFEGEADDRLRERVPALSPEILAQEVFLQWYDDQTAASDAAVLEAFTANPVSARERLISLVIERPDAASMRQPAAANEPGTLRALRRLATHVPDAWREAMLEEMKAWDDDAVNEEAEARVRAALVLWPSDPETLTVAAQRLQERVHQLGVACETTAAQGGEPDPDALLRLLDLLRGLAEGDPALVEHYSRALRCAATHWGVLAAAQDARGEAPDWRSLRDALLRLDALADRDDVTDAIRHECATGHVNAAVHYGMVVQAQIARCEAPDWSGLRGALARLAALADREDTTDAIRLQCAKGHMSATVGYGHVAQGQGERGEAPDWSGLGGVLARLDALADRNDATDAIRLQCAEGYMNATIYYGRVAQAQDARGEAPDWLSLRDALARLDALADRNDATYAIRLACAKGHMNATVAKGSVARAQDARGQAPDWLGLQEALARLDALADRDEATDEIRRQCASGHVNATVYYGNVTRAQGERGEAPDWSGLRSALARLDALADRDDATDAIRVECALGYRNATAYYGDFALKQDERGDVPDWTRLLTALARLDALADRDDATDAIRLQCAEGQMNATVNYSSVGEAQGERGEVPDWSGLRSALARLDALEDRDDATDAIRLQCAQGHMNASVGYVHVARAQITRGKGPDWIDLQASVDRIAELTEANPANVEIVTLAWYVFAAAEGNFRHGRNLLAAEQQRWRLKRLALAHPEDTALQEMLEQYYPHLTYLAQTRRSD